MNENLEQEIEKIKKRKQRVELDKAWETIFILHYICEKYKNVKD